MKYTAWQKFEAWVPQLLWFAVCIGSATVANSYQAVAGALIPLVATSVSAGLVFLVTGCTKVDRVTNSGGWSNIIVDQDEKACRQCRALETERDKLRLECGEFKDALIQLRLP